MILYRSSKQGFRNDVLNGRIVKEICAVLEENHIGYDESEVRSWKDSTARMALVMSATDLPDDTCVFIEYNVPFTSSRIDFGIAGLNSYGHESVIIVEMKGWEDGIRTTESTGMVYAEFYGRNTLHPSYQAWSYANYLHYFNSEVVDGQVDVIPCAYLYNYPHDLKDEVLEEERYEYFTSKALIFYSEDTPGFTEFIDKYVSRSNGTSTLDKIERGKLTVSASLQKSLRQVLTNRDFFAPMENQVEIYNRLLWGIRHAIDGKKKQVYIVRGGPGTGKTVLALKLLAELVGGYRNKYDRQHHFVPTLYVTKTSAPRATYSKELKRLANEVGLEYLFKGASSFIGCAYNDYPVILVDEAHRLANKSICFVKGGKNQVMEIINAAQISVFFIDEDQTVSMKDIGTIDEIERWADHYNAEIISDLKLSTQFRCKGSGLYLAWLDDVLKIRESKDISLLGKLPYDISVVDSPEELVSAIQKKRSEGYTARITAGYCWEWSSKDKKDKTLTDISIGSMNLRWNSSADTWANTESMREEVGCIHSSQGMEYQVSGVIIGPDLVFENDSIITVPSANMDGALSGYKKNPERADRIIRNTYRTLMTRGMDSCIVYCIDRSLSEYLKKRIQDIK